MPPSPLLHTLVVALALPLGGCSFRSLDGLSSGGAPSDAATPTPMADGAAGTGGTGGSGGTGGTGGTIAPAPGAQVLYWVDSGNDGVWTATIDGRNRRRLVALPDASFLRSIAVDGPGGKMYFSDSGLKRVQRAGLDGSGVQDVATGLEVPVGVAVDPGEGKLYFADQGASPAIYQANLDGTARKAIITAGITHPYGLALDSAGGHLYFVDNEVDVIFRASLDGRVVERLPVTGLAAPIEIAVDPVGRKLYWSDLGPPPRIRRANLDGSGVEDVINEARSSSLSTPLGIAVDGVARKLYYVDGGGGAVDGIRQAELDGAGIHLLLHDGLSAPRGLAIQ